jgi:hypothetical protein
MTCEKHSQVKLTVRLVYNEHGAMRPQLPAAYSNSKSNLAVFPHKHFMDTTSTLYGYMTQSLYAQHRLICDSHTL